MKNFKDELSYESRRSSVRGMAEEAYQRYMLLGTDKLGIADVIEAMYPKASASAKLGILNLIEEMYLKDRMNIN